MFIVDLEELLAPRRREGHVQLHGELTETEKEGGKVTTGRQGMEKPYR